MRHLGTRPQWVKITGKVEFPPDIICKYSDLMDQAVGEFENEFAKQLYERRFLITNMIVQPRGLTNQKLMCFANSSMQLLFASPYFLSFAYFMKNNLPLFTPKQREITPAWQAFSEFINNFQFSESGSSDGSLPSLKSLNILQKAKPTNLKILDDIFGIYSSRRQPINQEDASEFLAYFLNRLHEELIQLMKLAPINVDKGGWITQGTGRGGIILQETQGDMSPLSDIFDSLARADTLQNGKSRSVATESHLVLPLPIRGIKTVEEAIEQFTKEEIICREKGQPTISKKNTFISYPKSLIIGLKRFDFDPIEMNAIKLLDIVEYPDVLVLKRCIDEKPLQYQLCAIVEHIGKNPNGGHYICYSRTFDGRWLKFDDDRVTTIENEGHLELQAYMLLYNQITSVH